MDRRLSPRYFKKDEPLVARKVILINGKDLGPGDALPEELTTGQRLRLWTTGRAVYTKDFRPTPVEGAPDLDAVIVDDAEIEAAAQALDGPAPTVAMTHIGGGYYTLEPSWDALAAEKVHGKAAAEERQAAMLAEAPAATQEVAEDAAEAEGQTEAQKDASEQSGVVSEPEAEAKAETADAATEDGPTQTEE